MKDVIQKNLHILAPRLRQTRVIFKFGRSLFTCQLKQNDDLHDNGTRCRQLRRLTARWEK